MTDILDEIFKDVESKNLKDILLISPNELIEIIKAGKKALEAKPRKEEYIYANLYVKKATYLEWKTLCDELGVNYGPRVTTLMKMDIKILKAMKGTTERIISQ